MVNAMSDINYNSICAALDALESGALNESGGKVTGVNLARIAKVSKATLYRYLERNQELQERYSSLRKSTRPFRQAGATGATAETLSLSETVEALRSEMAQLRRVSEEKHKLHLHQIQILWMENRRLQSENSELRARHITNVFAMPVKR